MTIFEHPQLGKIEQVEDNEVLRFLGLTYASLEHPFAAPQVHSAKAEYIDATHHGPTAISPPFGCDFELSHIQHSLPHSSLPSSGTDCLNLNIFVPRDANTKLPSPVLVFHHGGGFVIGSNAWPQYDLTRLVNHSASLGHPVIGITIKHLRLPRHPPPPHRRRALKPRTKDLAFVYHFNEPNPWDGPNKGRANHILDGAFLFQNFHDFLSSEQSRSAGCFARDVIKFVAEEDPYPVREEDRGARGYGPPASGGLGFVKSKVEGQYGRRGLAGELVKQVGFDRLSDAVDVFIAGL